MVPVAADSVWQVTGVEPGRPGLLAAFWHAVSNRHVGDPCFVARISAIKLLPAPRAGAHTKLFTRYPHRELPMRRSRGDACGYAKAQVALRDGLAVASPLTDRVPDGDCVG